MCYYYLSYLIYFVFEAHIYNSWYTWHSSGTYNVCHLDIRYIAGFRVVEHLEHLIQLKD